MAVSSRRLQKELLDIKKEGTPDPTELDGEDDYISTAPVISKGRRRSGRTKTTTNYEEYFHGHPDEESEAIADEPAEDEDMNDEEDAAFDNDNTTEGGAQQDFAAYEAEDGAEYGDDDMLAYEDAGLPAYAANAEVRYPIGSLS